MLLGRSCSPGKTKDVGPSWCRSLSRWNWGVSMTATHVGLCSSRQAAKSGNGWRQTLSAGMCMLLLEGPGWQVVLCVELAAHQGT